MDTPGHTNWLHELPTLKGHEHSVKFILPLPHNVHFIDGDETSEVNWRPTMYWWPLDPTAAATVGFPHRHSYTECKRDQAQLKACPHWMRIEFASGLNRIGPVFSMRIEGARASTHNALKLDPQIFRDRALHAQVWHSN